MKQKAYLVIMTTGCFLAFAIFGFLDNMKGPLLPVLLEEFSLTYTQGSNILLMIYLGFMISVIGSGFIAEKRGSSNVLLISGIIATGATIGMSMTSGVLPLYPLLFLIGIALGGIEIGAMGTITDIYRNRSGRYLNILTVFHGGGSMSAPWFTGIMITAGFRWQAVYRASILPVLIFPILFLILRSHRRNDSTQNTENGEVPQKKKIRGLKLALLSLVLLFYVSSEVGLASWLVEFMYRKRDFPLNRASIMLTLFWGSIMAGRVAGSMIVEKLGYLKSLVSTSICALIVFSLGLLIPGVIFSFLIPLTGFFFSIIFPTITALATEQFPESKSRVHSILFFTAGLGGLTGPWIVGFSADLFGLETGFAMVAISVSAMLAVLLVLKSQLK